jgi:hypothetical protein
VELDLFDESPAITVSEEAGRQIIGHHVVLGLAAGRVDKNPPYLGELIILY